MPKDRGRHVSSGFSGAIQGGVRRGNLVKFDHIDPNLSEQVEAELLAGEELLWVGQPNQLRMMIQNPLPEVPIPKHPRVMIFRHTCETEKSMFKS